MDNDIIAPTQSDDCMGGSWQKASDDEKVSSLSSQSDNNWSVDDAGENSYQRSGTRLRAKRSPSDIGKGPLSYKKPLNYVREQQRKSPGTFEGVPLIERLKVRFREIDALLGPYGHRDVFSRPPPITRFPTLPRGAVPDIVPPCPSKTAPRYLDPTGSSDTTSLAGGRMIWRRSSRAYS
jgi:hypothetical protein